MEMNDAPAGTAEEATAGLLDVIESYAGTCCPVEAIFGAESARFAEAQVPRLLAALRKYVDANLQKNLRGDLLACVCSAIRKAVAVAPPHALAECVGWLNDSRGAPVQAEAEVTKMVRRKLVATMPWPPPVPPELVRSLRNVVGAYATPRLLEKRFFAAAALEALMGLALLGEAGEREASLVSFCGREWFVETVAREARAVGEEVARRHGSVPPKVAESLALLRRAATSASKDKGD